MTYCTLISNSNWFLVLILKVTLLKKPFILIFCRENLLKKTAAIISPADAIFSITIEDGGLGIWQFPQPFLNICVWGYIKDISAYYMRCFDVNVLFWQFYPMFVYKCAAFWGEGLDKLDKVYTSTQVNIWQVLQI